MTPYFFIYLTILGTILGSFLGPKIVSKRRQKIGPVLDTLGAGSQGVK